MTHDRIGEDVIRLTYVLLNLATRRMEIAALCLPLGWAKATGTARFSIRGFMQLTWKEVTRC